MARSAVRAKCSNELNSMWLPDRGSLHTVVLFTPGKCAARWICLTGLVTGASFRLGSGLGVPAGGPGQAQPRAKRPVLIGRTERAALLKKGYEICGDGRQIAG